MFPNPHPESKRDLAEKSNNGIGGRLVSVPRVDRPSLAAKDGCSLLETIYNAARQRKRLSKSENLVGRSFSGCKLLASKKCADSRKSKSSLSREKVTRSLFKHFSFPARLI
jgi:hypothetical protein